MRRCGFIVTSIACGLALSVLVSWVCALFAPFRDGSLSAEYDKTNTAIPRGLIPAGWEPRSWHAYWGPGIRRDMVSECEWHGSTIGMRMDGRPQRTVVHARAGFPFYAFTWYLSGQDLIDPKAGSFDRAWMLGIDLGWPRGRLFSAPRWGVEPRLPLRPLWGGLLANALCYAAFGAAAYWAIVRVRRVRRLRRGLCPVCRYPTGHLRRCPECGHEMETARV